MCYSHMSEDVQEGKSGHFLVVGEDDGIEGGKDRNGYEEPPRETGIPLTPPIQHNNTDVRNLASRTFSKCVCRLIS